MLTGMSLRPSDAVAVILRQCRDRSYAPIALPVFGTFDQMGGVDCIVEDANAALIVEFFVAQLDTGRLVANNYFAGDSIWPEPGWHSSAIDALIALVERNTTMWRFWGEHGDPAAQPVVPPAPLVSIDADPVVFALLARSTWDAIVVAAGEPDGSIEAVLDRAFGGDVVARQIYDGHLDAVGSAMRSLAAVSDFLGAHNRSWTPPGAGPYSGDYDQHYAEEMVAYLNRARADWRHNASIQAAIDRQAEPTMELIAEWERDERAALNRGDPDPN
ncbi:hypothetical protein MCHLDSM_01282 [Mycolicibacterium chlorophenolicum]|uniref:Uncharacterized protein n=2 Tax=Mycolicibacterium chlorophenolicum TaxID=37916 RepID=A0A0J6WJ94_9MYCO|nr:hypothetical protein MCHLDSM_01282 [Mycolicibacterium chlorophenolicum]